MFRVYYQQMLEIKTPHKLMIKHSKTMSPRKLYKNIEDIESMLF